MALSGSHYHVWKYRSAKESAGLTRCVQHWPRRTRLLDPCLRPNINGPHIMIKFLRVKPLLLLLRTLSCYIMSSGDANALSYQKSKDSSTPIPPRPNNPERVTITTDMGVPEYQVFTGDGHLFGSGPVSSIEKLWDGPDGGIRVGVT